MIGANVVLTKGEPQELKIEAEQNILDDIETNVSGGILKIDQDRCLDVHEEITVYITLASLEKITVTGAGTGKLIDSN